MRPLIAVTSSAEDDGRPVVRPAYVAALHAAGALPVPLPFLQGVAEARELLSGLDGVLLTGSEDLDASLWGEATHPAAELMHPARQATERAVCQVILDDDIPTLGICGGMQTLNVLAGGSVLQHIPDLLQTDLDLGQAALDHARDVGGARHRVRAEDGSRLAELLGGSFETNSVHHQAVGRLGEGVVVTGRTDDNIIEAFEMPGYAFVLCVQWHPERMLDAPRQATLFDALVSACRRTASA